MPPAATIVTTIAKICIPNPPEWSDGSLEITRIALFRTAMYVSILCAL